MIKFNVTGDLRSIANAAWISTMDQSKAEQRSEEDVDRVTSFLAKNAHSSPFEAVTISFVIDTEEYKDTFRRFRATRYYNHAKYFVLMIDRF